MQELTQNVPKPLLPVADVPLIFYSLFQLFLWKVDRTIINLHYHGQQIRQALKNFGWFEIVFSEEIEILGTAGGIRSALPFLHPEEDLVVLNPDAILSGRAADHPRQLAPENDSCLYLHKRHKGEYTGWSFDSRGRLHADTAGSFFYIGYSVLRPAALMHLDPGKRSELGSLWQEQARQGRLAGKVYEGLHLDVGDKMKYLAIKDTWPFPDRYQKEWDEFLKKAL